MAAVAARGVIFERRTDFVTRLKEHAAQELDKKILIFMETCLSCYETYPTNELRVEALLKNKTLSFVSTSYGRRKQALTDLLSELSRFRMGDCRTPKGRKNCYEAVREISQCFITIIAERILRNLESTYLAFESCDLTPDLPLLEEGLQLLGWQELNLRNNSLLTLSAFLHSPGLRVLKITGNPGLKRFTDSPDDVDLPELEELDVSDNPELEQLPRGLAKCSKLFYLRIGNTKITAAPRVGGLTIDLRPKLFEEEYQDALCYHEGDDAKKREIIEKYKGCFPQAGLIVDTKLEEIKAMIQRFNALHENWESALKTKT